MSETEAKYYVHPGAQTVSEIWGDLHRSEATHPFVMVFPKQRYALVVFNMGQSGRVLTYTGYMDVIECMRRHSVGAKSWAASGGRRVVRCAKIPLASAELCAAELVEMLNADAIDTEPEPARESWTEIGMKAQA